MIARCICVCTKVVILLCALSARRDLRSWVRDHNTWFAGRAQSSPRGADNRMGQPRAAVCLLSRRGKNQPPGKLSACSRDDNTPVHVHVGTTISHEFRRVKTAKTDAQELLDNDDATLWYSFLNYYLIFLYKKKLHVLIYFNQINLNICVADQEKE